MSSFLLADPTTIQTTDPRLQALFQLAQEGVEEAASDLWHEYGVLISPGRHLVLTCGELCRANARMMMAATMARWTS
jgi:hypothetical protein